VSAEHPGSEIPPGAEHGGERREERRGAWRRRYAGSLLEELISALGALEFGNRIILFGAALLLSVLPLVILLNALANQRVDDDISQRLGLNRAGSHVIEGLFRPSAVTFNLSVLVSLLLGLAGTIAVARSVQIIYEKAYDLTPARGVANLLRCLVWVVVVAGVLVADAASAPGLRHEPVGWLVLGVVDFAGLTLFFWWSAHFLLVRRQPWRRVWPVALATALFWIGLGVFASVYFSSTVISDSHLYGTIGVVFTLVTWFIAIGAVLTLGAVSGLIWLKHRESRGS
jgi:membrane protein